MSSKTRNRGGKGSSGIADEGRDPGYAPMITNLIPLLTSGWLAGDKREPKPSAHQEKTPKGKKTKSTSDGGESGSSEQDESKPCGPKFDKSPAHKIRICGGHAVTGTIVQVVRWGDYLAVHISPDPECPVHKRVSKQVHSTHKGGGEKVSALATLIEQQSIQMPDAVANPEKGPKGKLSDAESGAIEGFAKKLAHAYLSKLRKREHAVCATPKKGVGSARETIERDLLELEESRQPTAVAVVTELPKKPTVRVVEHEGATELEPIEQGAEVCAGVSVAGAGVAGNEVEITT